MRFADVFECNLKNNYRLRWDKVWLKTSNIYCQKAEIRWVRGYNVDYIVRLRQHT